MVGGKETAIEAARMLQGEDERLKKVVLAYDSASERDKRDLKVEDLCLAADISPDDFLGVIIPGLWRRNLDIGKLLAAMAHPKIIEASIQSAQTPFGSFDRQMLHQASGFLPSKTGPSIVIDNSRKTLVAGGNGKVVDTSGPGLPSFEQDAIEGAQVLRGDSGSGLNNKLLPAPRDSQAVLTPGLKEKSSDSSYNDVIDADPVESDV